jgi:hypothetical protein
MTRFLFSVLTVRVSWCGAPSLTRGWFYNLLVQLLLALPDQTLSGPSPTELATIFYCLIWDSPNLEGKVPILISLRNRIAQLYPQALCSLFVASYGPQGFGEGILTRLHTGLMATRYIQPRHGPQRILWLSVSRRSILTLSFHLLPSNIKIDLREIGNVFNLLYWQFATWIEQYLFLWS